GHVGDAGEHDVRPDVPGQAQPLGRGDQVPPDHRAEPPAAVRRVHQPGAPGVRAQPAVARYPVSGPDVPVEVERVADGEPGDAARCAASRGTAPSSGYRPARWSPAPAGLPRRGTPAAAGRSWPAGRSATGVPRRAVRPPAVRPGPTRRWSAPSPRTRPRTRRAGPGSAWRWGPSSRRAAPCGYRDGPAPR